MQFSENMGRADRIIRPAVALGMIALYATGKVRGPGGIALLALSGIFLATGASGYCPLYDVLGIDSCGSSEKPAATLHRGTRSMG